MYIYIYIYTREYMRTYVYKVTYDIYSHSVKCLRKEVGYIKILMDVMIV